MRYANIRLSLQMPEEQKHHTIRKRALKRNVDRRENYINYIFPNRRFNEGVSKLPDEVKQ